MTMSSQELFGYVSSALQETGPAWLPGLAHAVANAGWQTLAPTLLTRDTYGSARVRAGRCDAERDVADRIPLPTAFAIPHPVVVETLRPGAATRYRDLGLDLASRTEAAEARHRLDRAFDKLAEVPTAAAAIGSVLAILHVVVPDGPDYDVSYSDPELPFSIFVGVPREVSPFADLRLAEGILHECMHLQLSLIEAVVPLVRETDQRYYSPWQGIMRPAQGILHGLYVFATIRDFMEHLMERPGNEKGEITYMADRIRLCGVEIGETAASLVGGDALTAAGLALVTCLASP